MEKNRRECPAVARWEVWREGTGGGTAQRVNCDDATAVEHRKDCIPSIVPPHTHGYNPLIQLVCPYELSYLHRARLVGLHFASFAANQ